MTSTVIANRTAALVESNVFVDYLPILSLAFITHPMQTARSAHLATTTTTTTMTAMATRKVCPNRTTSVPVRLAELVVQASVTVVS
tara:strand:+ start:222 stop:479 length:258 start_codon:yes stop_codon:yes gene_type:complete